MHEIYKNIREQRLRLGMSQTELAQKTGYKDKSAIAKIEAGKNDLSSSKITIFAKALGVSPSWLMGWDNALEKHVKLFENVGVKVPVLGSVPAGIPIEAIEDIVDEEEIPSSWLNGDQEYFALRVKGDSMYPKYIEGDTIILRKQDDCESGQDCVVYVNGYDATLKKVVKTGSAIVLQPLNPSYEPKVYSVDDTSNPIKIAGVVIEIRRKV